VAVPCPSHHRGRLGGNRPPGNAGSGDRSE
jgi:hypothetical protein